MDGQLKTGAVLTSESGSSYKVNKLLGSGGQGEVYDVECGKRHLALKWFYKKMSTQQQKKILDNLVAKGSPDKSFLWPQDLIYTKPGESFGYIMELRPKNYKKIPDFMFRRAEPTFSALCRAAYNLVYGYEKLHSKGMCYGDINFGNAFIDPETGDVLICDTDNVVPNRSSISIDGTQGFMAPEIERGEAKPSRNTDLYSLAVLLFYMLMLGHPLEGKLEYEIKCLDPVARRKLYGTNPVFIFDTQNKSNRPVRGYQDNVIIYWDVYPQVIRNLFTKSFMEGLAEPSKRITEKKWMETFANLISCINYCPKCGAEVFFDEIKTAQSVAHICWGCQGAVQMPITLVIGNSRVLMQKDARLYSHFVYDDYDMTTIVGKVVQNPKNPSLWGIKNESKDNWTYIKPDGTQVPVAIGSTAAIAKGVKFNFGSKTGEFI